MLRGSRLYGSSVKGSTIEKLRMSVFSVRKGSTYAVVGSGTSFMSDSWIGWNPRIEEPSNIWHSVKKSTVSDLAGTLKCCITPGRSQNLTSTNLTSSSLMNARTSSALLNIQPPVVGPGGGADPGCVGTTLTRTDFSAVTRVFRRCYAPSDLD